MMKVRKLSPQYNTRLERTRHERASLLSCVGEPLKHDVRCLLEIHEMSEADDTIRSPKGVVACLRDNGNGTSSLIFDDVDGNSINNPIEWSFSCFYTWHEYDNSVLEQMKLSDLEYQ